MSVADKVGDAHHRPRLLDLAEDRGPVARSFSGKQSALRRAAAGFTIVQVMVAMGVIVICGIAGVQTLVLINQKAAAMRLLTNARAVVQRNIDTALCVPFSSTIQPALLAVTAPAGAVYDDDDGGDNLVSIALTRAGTDAVVRGTLTRTVLAEANADGVDIRRCTFRLDYTFRRHAYSYEMTTLRTVD